MDIFNRYSRQIFIDEIGVDGQRSLMKSRVLVIGAGGLGSIVIAYLVAAGVGKVGVADFDNVEWHNLNRQIIHSEVNIGENKAKSAKQFAQNLNGSVEFVCIEEKIDSRNIRDYMDGYDLVVDCSDNFSTRYLINDTCVVLDKPLVYGSVFAFEGQVAVFNLYGSKDLRSIFPEPPLSELVPNCDSNGVLGPLPGVVGSMMSMLALQILVGSNVFVNGLTIVDLKSWNFSKIQF